jgi:hypothetical protein
VTKPKNKGSNGDRAKGRSKAAPKPLAPTAAAGVSAAGPHTIAMGAVDDPAPGQVLELAAACVRFVLAQVKIEPDFTSETLALVDHYVAEAAGAVKDRPEALALTAHALGAYLGEVVRRRHACWWRIDDADPGAWRLEFRNVFLSFYPVQVAYASLTRTEDDASFSGFELPDKDRDGLIDRLAQLPEVREDEYWAPSTKLEVLDIVVDALLAQRAQDPLGAGPLGPEDYAGESGGQD